MGALYYIIDNNEEIPFHEFIKHTDSWELWEGQLFSPSVDDKRKEYLMTNPSNITKGDLNWTVKYAKVPHYEIYYFVWSAIEFVFAEEKEIERLQIDILD